MNKDYANQILNLTHGGKDVFEKYFGKGVTRAAWFRNPYREDRNPSCKIYYQQRNGVSVPQYYMVDFGDPQYCGSAIDLVKSMTHTDFINACKIIDREFCLGVFKDEELKKMRKYSFDKKKNPVKMVGQNNSNSKIKEFKVTDRPFSDKDLKYWGQYGIGKDTLDRFNVVSIDHVWCKRKDDSTYFIPRVAGKDAVPHFAEDDLVYGYKVNGGQGLKVYQPLKHGFMEAGKLGSPYIFGREQLPEKGDVMFITGGEKDCLSLSAHGFNAVSYNSESGNIPEEHMKEFSMRFKNICFLYDMDPTGVEQSTNRVREFRDSYNVHRIQLPLSGEKSDLKSGKSSDKDISDFFRDGHTAGELKNIVEDTIKADEQKKASERKPVMHITL